jgi:DNA-directed RNA polymerase subunit B'
MSNEKTSVFLNGRLIGFHPDGAALAASLRQKRRTGALSAEANVSFFPETRELYINSESGRARRPYVVVEGGKSRYTAEIREKVRKGEIGWKELVKNGIVEYLDAEEEENAYIAVDEAALASRHTHLEIDPMTILGSVASQMPFPEYNSSPRITMACAMGKQSLGLYSGNFNLRMDSRSHVSYYPQQPLIQTRSYKTLRLAERPAGQNFVVAITSYYGYNMRDAVVVNKSAIERALGRTLFYRTYESEERRYPGGQKDRFEAPDAAVTGYRGEEAYRFLGDDGIVVPESEVKAGDVIIGKTSPPRFLEEVSMFGVTEEKRRENSVTVRSGEEGVVDAVMISESPSGNKMVKVKVRSAKTPETGDKFASRHGQKGVIGLLLPQEDMPFTADGVVPDLILNPHAIPSRMTAGHILEMLGGKACSLGGRIGDGSAFGGDREEMYKQALMQYGFKPDGKEVLYDGQSGEAIETQIFVGVVYYQKLHHLVSNKMHVRSRGPVQMLTRQPTEGRAREGGLRFGEMERDCLIGHGTSMLLRERLLEESDKTTELVCGKCGMSAVHDRVRNRNYCPLCGDSAIHEIEIGYAFKLLLDEMKSIGIFPRMVLKDKA